MKAHRTQKGFTILEAMIAMAVLTFGILVLQKMQLVAMNGNKKAIYLTTAANLASRQIEELRALPYSDPSLSDNDTNIDGSETHYPPAGSLPSGYAMSWTVWEDVPIFDSKRIQIQVTGGSGTQASTVTYTYIKARGT